MSSPAPATPVSVASLRSGTPSFRRPATPADHIIPNQAGYATPVFKGKEEQAGKVTELLHEKGYIPDSLIQAEVEWFYRGLGIDDTYFALESPATIADHVTALFGARVLAHTKHTPSLDVDLQKEADDGSGALYIHSSQPGRGNKGKPAWERRIDELYLNNTTLSHSYRLESYRSAGPVSAQSQQQLRCYFLTKSDFVQPIPKLGSAESTDIRRVSDKNFLARASENTLSMYQDVMTEVLRRSGPVIEVYEVEGTPEHRVVVGYRQGPTSNYFSSFSDLYHFYGLFSSRKYVEQFSNGVTIFCAYLNPLRLSGYPPIEHSINQITREASLLYSLPDNPFFKVGDAANSQEGHAVQEATYAYVGWLFAQHFCNRLGQSYQALRGALDESDAAQASILNEIKTRFREETFTRAGIQDVLERYPELIRLLYVHFANIHYPGGAGDDELVPTLSYQRLVKEEVLTDAQIHDRIRKATNNVHELQVLESLLKFNKSVLKTNFYTPTKVALAFRLDPSFLPEAEYPVKPFGIFFIVGSDFRGFHVRFSDIARGGIRIVRSRNRENYSINQRTLFDENYGLAMTQHLKNKDIPEGGSKGTILPTLDANPKLCFEKYVDAIIDLLIKGETPGVKEEIVDLYGKEEILFFGPDEGTADFMDWGAEHARARGAPWWKSFTTGKTAATLGGVPHDVWGMTSLSIRQYVLGLYRRLGLDEKQVTKVQTGGPDGDLGSNEILLSSDRTTTIIDGSGVLHDPTGLDRDELIRLAKTRKMINHFDAGKLGKGGFRVLVDDKDLTLPTGEVVPDGLSYRNTAHLVFRADLFVPCGGRPEAISISNVGKLFDAEGKPHFRYIVEGANLFITRQARIELEKHGVILYPDASANKGGVTSSSLEVLCGLSLTDDEFMQNMTFQGGKPTPFYLGYVRDIQSIIARNAAMEFEAIWREHQATGRPRSVLSTELSTALNVLSDEIAATNLYDDDTVRRSVMAHVFPSTLRKKVALDTLVDRIPSAYSRSAFAAFVAASFIYAHGSTASHVQFYQHINKLRQDAPIA